MKYVLFYDGEEMVRGSEKEVREYIQSVKTDYINDDRENRQKWPEDYSANYSFEEAFKEYFHDVYELFETSDVGKFL